VVLQRSIGRWWIDCVYIGQAKNSKKVVVVYAIALYWMARAAEVWGKGSGEIKYGCTHWIRKRYFNFKGKSIHKIKAIRQGWSIPFDHVVAAAMLLCLSKKKYKPPRGGGLFFFLEGGGPGKFFLKGELEVLLMSIYKDGGGIIP